MCGGVMRPAGCGGVHALQLMERRWDTRSGPLFGRVYGAGGVHDVAIEDRPPVVACGVCLQPTARPAPGSGLAMVYLGLE